MLRKIWIFESYSLMIIIGVILGLFIFYKLLEKENVSKKFIYSLLSLSCFTIVAGFLFATLTQYLIDLADKNFGCC